MLIIILHSCSKDSESSVTINSNTVNNESISVNLSSENSTSNSSISDSSEIKNSNCDGYDYDSRPEPISSDETHRYYQFSWQSDPKICVNIYEPSLLNGRDEKLKASINWLKINLPNIIPVNVFFIDQFNASQEAKLQHDTDFCNLVRESNEVNNCIDENKSSWGERSYGGGVYARYLHKGADLMIYDDAFVENEGEDAGLIYLAHEYFHTFQTSNMYYFEEKNLFGIRKKDDEENIPVPYLPIWIGEGGANFASLTLMAKQNLDFDHYGQAIRFLNQARRAMEGSDSSFSLKNFESENTRINDEYYAYDGGFMAHVYLWNLNKNNFKKLMVDYYTIFAEKYKLNPTGAWKDAFEETFGIKLDDFYKDFDLFMKKEVDSQIAIIKSSNEWIDASWD